MKASDRLEQWPPHSLDLARVCGKPLFWLSPCCFAAFGAAWKKRPRPTYNDAKQNDHILNDHKIKRFPTPTACVRDLRPQWAEP